MAEVKTPLMGKVEDLVKELGGQAHDQLGVLKKVKAMLKIAKDIGEDTETADKFVDIAETLLHDIEDKLKPSAKTE